MKGRLKEVSQSPFTPEQTKWLEESRRDSVRRAIRHFRNAALLGYLVLAIGIGVVFAEQRHDNSVRRQEARGERHAIVSSGREVSVFGCNRDFQTIQALRGVLIAGRDFQRAANKSGVISDERLRASDAFYKQQLMRLRLPDCRQSALIVTSNPDFRYHATPLHP